MSWISDLDACASAGIIEFDAPAYIKGTQPRYFGNPPLETIPGELPPIKQQPKKDEFKPSNDTLQNNPSWKKWLFSALIATGAVLGLKRLGAFKKLTPKIDLSKLKGIPQKIWNGIQTGWQTIVNKFKRTP